MTESLEATFIGGAKDGDVQTLPGDSYPSTIEIKARTSVGGKPEAFEVMTYHLVPGEVMTGIYVEDLSAWDVATVKQRQHGALLGVFEEGNPLKFITGILVTQLETYDVEPDSICIAHIPVEESDMFDLVVQGIKKKTHEKAT